MPSLYETLGVSKSASLDDIKKAYRKLAVKHHPDKGGSEEKFKDISHAFTILSDPQKRRHYDNFGEAPGGGSTGPDPFNMFHSFFNNNDMFSNFGFRTRQRQTKQKVSLRVSLEDLYTGKSNTFRLSRDRACSVCNGNGGKGPNIQCTRCNGHGVLKQVVQIAPGIQQQFSGTCPECNGEGQYIKDKCEACNGSKLVEETTEITIDIKPGTKHGDSIVLSGEGFYDTHSKQNMDLVLIVNEQPHNRFKRKGNDLHLEQVVYLYDAITGAKVNIVHLNGEKYTLFAGAVISPDQTYVVKGLGMPIMEHPNSFGNLYIRFKIIFPDHLLQVTMPLQDILPSNSPEDTYEKRVLEVFTGD